MRRYYHDYRTPSARAEALSLLLEIDVEALRVWIVQADESDGQKPDQPTGEQKMMDACLIWALGLDPDDDTYVFDGPG